MNSLKMLIERMLLSPQLISDGIFITYNTSVMRKLNTTLCDLTVCFWENAEI